MPPTAWFSTLTAELYYRISKRRIVFESVVLGFVCRDLNGGRELVEVQLLAVGILHAERGAGAAEG